METYILVTFTTFCRQFYIYISLIAEMIFFFQMKYFSDNLYMFIVFYKNLQNGGRRKDIHYFFMLVYVENKNTKI